MLYPAGRPPAPFATCVARIVKRSGLFRSQPVELDMRRIGTSVEARNEGEVVSQHVVVVHGRWRIRASCSDRGGPTALRDVDR